MSVIETGVTPGSAALTKRSSAQAVPVFLAFLAMGFGDASGPFVSLAKQEFNLSNFAAQLIAFSGYIMFGLLSVPMGIFQDKKGKKFVLMLSGHHAGGRPHSRGRGILHFPGAFAGGVAAGRSDACP